MKRSATLFLLISLIILACAATAEAGRLYARRPGTETPIYNLKITRILTTVQVWNQLAVTHVDEEFYNGNNMTLEGFYAFQLPEGAKVDGLWLWVDGKRLIFSVKKKEEAERQYDSVVIGTPRRDPAILESLGANRFQLKVWPINPNSSRRIEIQYFNTLPMDSDGWIQYSYPLNSQNYQTDPVDLTDISITVRGEQNIVDLRTSFDNRPAMNRVTRLGDRQYQIRFGTENQTYLEDYKLQFKLDRIQELFPAITWKDPQNQLEDPYFMMWFPLQATVSNTRPRDYVFVLDASGSMDGERITLVRDAMTKILRSLSESDRFRIVQFSSNAVSEPPDTSLLFATKENVAAAIQYIRYDYSAGGGTNYEEAFRAGLSGNFRYEAEKRMLFLTDGEPTVGAMDYATLIAFIRAIDKANVRIFPVLLYPTQIKLLYDIAADRWGKATNLEVGDDLETVIARLIFDLNQGGFSDFSATYKGGIAYDIYPRSFKTVTSADQLVTAGRFKEDGTETITAQWTGGDGSINYLTRNTDLLATHSSLIQVSRFWASRKIDALLDDIKVYGETKELKDNVIALSCKYMILTPYTAFLVLETNPIDPTDVAAEGTVARGFELHQNYPNPFNPSTAIAFEIPAQAPVRLVIYDALGRIVRVLVDGTLPAGRHTVVWDGRDAQGRPLSSGAYVCTLTSGGAVRSIRMALVK